MNEGGDKSRSRCLRDRFQSAFDLNRSDRMPHRSGPKVVGVGRQTGGEGESGSVGFRRVLCGEQGEGGMEVRVKGEGRDMRRRGAFRVWKRGMSHIGFWRWSARVAGGLAKDVPMFPKQEGLRTCPKAQCRCRMLGMQPEKGRTHFEAYNETRRSLWTLGSRDRGLHHLG